MHRRFYASHQVAGPNRTNKNLWFSTAPEAERACDELWTAECRQEIVDRRDLRAGRTLRVRGCVAESEIRLAEVRVHVSGVGAVYL